jgi:hypothetical protein
MASENLFAFVLMPFDKAFTDIYKLGIKETSASLGIKAERLDEQIFQEGMLARIYRQIDVADIVIADMTDQNPNVFYEVGYAHAKEKLCLLLTKNADDIPFDLKHLRHIVYGNSITNLKDMLFEELSWAKREIETFRASHIKVSLKNAYGSLELQKFWAKGFIDIKVDLSNNSQNVSAEIEAIYFYSSKGWTLTQDDKECAFTESDIKEFTSRHFLTPPIRTLHKNSWAQLKFKTTKILAWATEGQELKDSYKINGKAIIRLVTSKGHYDYGITIDTTCEEFPF